MSYYFKSTRLAEFQIVDNSGVNVDRGNKKMIALAAKAFL